MQRMHLVNYNITKDSGDYAGKCVKVLDKMMDCLECFEFTKTVKEKKHA